MNQINPLIYCILIVIEYLVFKNKKKTWRRKKKQQALEWAFLSAVIMVLVQIGTGFFFGNFAKSPYDHSAFGMLENGGRLFLWLWLRETVRSHFVSVKKIRWISLALFSTGIFFLEGNHSQILLLQGTKEIVIYFFEIVIPFFVQQMLLGIFVTYGGRSAGFLYAAVIGAFEWYFPILPEVDWFITMIIKISVPVLMGSLFIEATEKKKRAKTSGNLWVDAGVLATCILVIWFFAGVFPVYPSVVLTGSMEPGLKPGDMILIKKITKESEVNHLKKGEVLNFTRDNINISHRIIKIKNKDGEKTFRTKGDNNSVADRQNVKPQQIKGKVIGKIKKAGLLVLWLKGSDSKIRKKVEF